MRKVILLVGTIGAIYHRVRGINPTEVALKKVSDDLVNLDIQRDALLMRQKHLQRELDAGR